MSEQKLTREQVEAHPGYGSGYVYFPKGAHPDCNHGVDDGCEWCCERCNKDSHVCPGCGTVAGHKNAPCSGCEGLS